MIRNILIASFLALYSCSSLEPAFAQQPPSYVTIVLDEAKFSAFYNSLSDIPMTGKTWQQIVALLQSLEREAAQERARTEVPKVVGAPTNKE